MKVSQQSVTELTYEQKLQIADSYLGNKLGISWDDLSDINSLHDAEDIGDIHMLCDDRLEESGFDTSFLDED